MQSKDCTLETYILLAESMSISDPSKHRLGIEKGSGGVSQLVERLLPIPEVHGSTPVICKNLFILNICLLSTVY